MSRFLLEKLTGSQLAKKSRAIMKPAGSLRHSQQLATYPYSELDQPSQSLRIPRLEDQFSYYFPIYTCIFQMVSFPRISSPKPCMHLMYPIYATCPAHFIFLDLITDQYLVRSTDHKIPRCVVSSISLFSRLFQAKISSLDSLFSNTLSLCFFLNVKNQVSHPYRTTGKGNVQYFLQ